MVSSDAIAVPRLRRLPGEFRGQFYAPLDYTQWFLRKALTAFSDNPHHPTTPGIEVLSRMLAYYRKHIGDLPCTLHQFKTLVMDAAIE